MGALRADPLLTLPQQLRVVSPLSMCGCVHCIAKACQNLTTCGKKSQQLRRLEHCDTIMAS
jgi:hypothetical protein